MPMRSLTADRIAACRQGTFGRFAPERAQKKLDLLQLASLCVAQPSTGPLLRLMRHRPGISPLKGSTQSLGDRVKKRHSPSENQPNQNQPGGPAA